MATKRSIAEIRLQASGGAQAAKQIGQVGDATVKLDRNTTRLGQSSASAGRSFSAQANGLGGLVGAYAAAAANIFAITAAFTALSRAAQAEQTIAGLNTLASQFGLLGTEVADSLDRITKGQLNVAEVAQQANLAISAGLGDQLEGLTEVALKASRALGRNLSDSFQRIIRGVGKLEPELLDELGIFTRIEPAIQRYALETGKSASALTNFERRQAFANAALTEGQRKFSAINTTTATSAEKLERLGATITNIGLELGGFIAGPLADFADFITNNASAAVLAIGLLLRQVFGATLTGALGAFDKGTKNLSQSLSALSAKAVASAAAFTAAITSIQTKASTLPPPSRLFGGQAGAEGREVFGRIRRGETISPAEAKGAAKALNELADAQTANEKTLASSKTQAEANQKALRGLAKEVGGLESQTTRFGKVYTLTLRGVTAATNLFRAAVISLVAVLNKVFIVVAIVEGALAILGQIIDKNLSVLAFLARAFRNVTRESRELKKSASDLASSFTKDVNTMGLTAAQAEEAFSNFGKTVSDSLSIGTYGIAVDEVKDFFGTVEGTIVDSIVGALATVLLLIPQLAYKLGLLIVDGITEAFALSGLDFFEDIADSFDDGLQAFKDEGALRRIEREIEGLEERSKGLGVEARQAFLQLQAFKELQALFNDFGVGIVRTFQRLEVLTGLTAQNFKELADRNILQSGDGGGLILEINGIALGIATANGQLIEFTEAADSALIAAAQAFVTFDEAFARGAVNAESAGQAVVQLTNLLSRAESELNKQRQADLTDVSQTLLGRVETQKLIIKELENELTRVEKLKEELVVIEALQKAISSQTSGGRKTVEQGSASGIFDAQGNIASTSIEQQRARLDFQNAILQATQAEIDLSARDLQIKKDRLAIVKSDLDAQNALLDQSNLLVAKAQEQGASEAEIAKLEKQREAFIERISGIKKTESDLSKDLIEINARQAALQTVIRDITLGNLGNIVKTKDAVNQLLKAQERQTKQLRDQIQITQLQTALENEKRDINLEFQRANNQATSDRNAANLLQKQNNLFEAQLKTQQSLAKLDDQRTKSVITRIEAEQQLADIQNQRNIQGIESRFDPAISAQQSRVSDLEAFPNLSSQRQLQAEQAKLIALETAKQLEVLAERERQANEQFEREKEVIRLKRAAAFDEITRLQELNVQQRISQQKQLDAFDAKARADQAAAQADINRKVAELLLLEDQERIANTQARIDRETQQFRIDDLRKQAELLRAQAVNQDAFLNGQAELIKQQLVVVNAQRELAGLNPVTISSFQSDVTKTISEADRLLKELTTQEGLLDGILANRIANNAEIRKDAEALKNLEISAAVEKKQFAEQTAALDRRILEEKFNAQNIENQALQEATQERATALGEERDRLEETFNLNKDKFAAEKADIIATGEERIRQLQREAASIERLVNAITGDLNQGIEDLFTTAFDNIANNDNITKGLKDVLVNTFDKVRQTVLKQTLIEPAQEFLSEQIGGLFGLSGETKGADNAKVTAGGSLQVYVVNSAGENPIADAVKNLDTESSNVFTNIGDKVNEFGTSVGSTFSELGTAASDLFSSVFSSFSGGGGGGGFGSLLSGIFGASSAAGPAVAGASIGASPFSGGPPGVFASGGLVKMAAGGMMRDRVPAMLEPGEFVVRKQAAKVAGAPALNSLNSTGSMGGDVSINIQNEGQAKDAEASQPRFDGEKFVIDVVMRDLSNNGPIRKSLRAGG